MKKMTVKNLPAALKTWVLVFMEGDEFVFYCTLDDIVLAGQAVEYNDFDLIVVHREAVTA